MLFVSSLFVYGYTSAYVFKRATGYVLVIAAAKSISRETSIKVKKKDLCWG